MSVSARSSVQGGVIWAEVVGHQHVERGLGPGACLDGKCPARPPPPTTGNGSAVSLRRSAMTFGSTYTHPFGQGMASSFLGCPQGSVQVAC